MYTYIVQQYFPLLSMTLFICWFIVLMQMMWLYTDEIVGKGLDFIIILQLVFHAAVMVLPTAAPLGILLASLMTFGSMGERLELLAMKSAGVPLHRIMAPLFFIVLTLSASLFIYLNTAVMNAQVRFFQIVFSAREARPDLDIPEGAFYNGIRGYSIFVGKKNTEQKTLEEIMIYDYSQFESPRVITADSGALRLDSSKRFLTLNLYKGESFEPLEGQAFSSSNAIPAEDVPASYLKEKFSFKQIVINLNMNFEMIDDGGLRSQFVGKNLIQLNHYLRDTAQRELDSVSFMNAKGALEASQVDRFVMMAATPLDQTPSGQEKWKNTTTAASDKNISLDSLYKQVSGEKMVSVLREASSRLDQVSDAALFRNEVYQQQAYFYRTHAQEWHRKFTFPVACLVFFFIGAPLGAIIRKGGIGMPMVASVLFFVVYYMLDTFGYNLSYNGTWAPWFGMWFSTIVLSPFGIFLTYKATRDSSSLNIDAIVIRLKQWFRKEKTREIQFRELILNPISIEHARRLIDNCNAALHSVETNPFLATRALSPQGLRTSRRNPLKFLPAVCNSAIGSLQTLNRDHALLSKEIETVVEQLQNFDNKLVVAKLMDMPILPPSFAPLIPSPKTTLGRLFIVQWSLLPYVVYCYKKRKGEKKLLRQCRKVLDELTDIIEKLTNRQIEE